MELQLICQERLKNVLTKDKSDSPNRIMNVLKSELLYVLKNYMEISSQNVELSMVVNQNGYYEINLFATVRRLKLASNIPNEEES